MFPASCSLHVHSDSQAAIAGIRAYERQTNERQRLRMAARPLLQLIHHLLSVREQAGSSLTLQHVKAHTHNTDMHSVGNRLSDFQANRARLKPLQPKPLCLRELLLQQCEHYVSMWRPSPEAGTPLMIIDDIRRAAMSQLQAAALSRHAKDAAKPESTSYLIGDGSLELGGIVLSHGSASLQRAFVHVATNSIHHLWLPTGRADRSHTVQCLTCVPCTAAHAPPQAFTLQHLVACPHRAAIAFRVKSERAFPALGLGAEAAQDDAVDQLVQLHARLCHMGWTRMMNLLHGGKVEDHGIQVPGLHDRTIREAEQRVRECVACVQGRATRTAFGHRGLDRGAKPGECLHMDTYQVKVDRDGRLVTEYGLVMKDLHTEHVWHAKVQSKDLVAEAVIQRVRRAETQFGCVVKRIYADGGTEFINRTLKKFCEDNGKQLHWTPARSQQLNGAAERTVRTSKESASMMLQHSRAPIRLWSWAAGHAAFVWNRTHISVTTGVTPYESMRGKRPSLKHLGGTWGCDAYCHVPKEQRAALEAKAEPCIYLGHDEVQNAANVLLLSTKKVICSRDVKYRSGSFTFVKAF